MYLSKEKCTCPKEQISLNLSVLKQFTLSNSKQSDIIYLVNSVDPDQLASIKAS